MELELLKKRFDTPKLNKYLEQLDETIEGNFWASIVAIKDIFPNADIYHAGSSKFGYLGVGIKPNREVRVKEFILVCSINENYDEGKNYYIEYGVIKNLYTYLATQDDQVSQSFKPVAQQIEDFKTWLKQVKKYTAKFNFELNGQALLPSDYNEAYLDQTNIDQFQDQDTNVNELEKSLNRILFGPAGTGKTYHTINHALAILDGRDVEQEQTQDDRDRFTRYMEEGRIEFVTFHQSYGYEEFVEGIRVKTVNEDTKDENSKKILNYDVESGIFKKLCGRAEISLLKQDSNTKSNAVEENLQSISEFIFKYIKENDQYELISESSTFTVQIKGEVDKKFKIFKNNFDDEFRLISLKNIINYLQVGTDKIIDNTSYERAIARSMLNNKGEEIAKIFNNDLESKKPYILIIDEINRGNISKIFGELITLIEDSKRSGNKEPLSVTLPYSGKPFSVPNNLYIIGTMNSSDRSLTSLDLALRRRFEFIEMLPNPEVLANITISGISTKELLEIINKRIKALLDQDHCIGHANFTHLTLSSTVQELMAVFEKKIIPLLQEYFFNDWEKINLVLGDNGMIVKDIIDKTLFPNSFSSQLERLNSRSWKINTTLFKSPEENQIKSLKKIVLPQNKTNGDNE